jgi:hypothetical protein
MTDIGTLNHPFSASYAIGQLRLGKSSAEVRAIDNMRESLSEFEGRIITLALGQTIRRRILALQKIGSELAGLPHVRRGFGA